jgi:hypothetical protein
VYEAIPVTSWTSDNLTQFLNQVHLNQKANVAKFAEPYRLIRRVNECLSIAGENLVNPKPVMTGVLFQRSQYAYKTAAGMALAGQVVETFVMLRSCLEYAGYALAIFNEPDLQVVFMSRHVSDDGMKAQKEKFRMSEIRQVIASFDAKLAELFQLFYERSIDFGGHPNPHATMSAVQIGHEGSDSTITTFALSTEPKVLSHAMKSVAQVGLTALFIFQHIFKAKFELLGINAEMNALRNENL